MKTLVLGIIVFLTAISGLNAQDIKPALPVDPDTKLVTYREVVTVTGTQEELFNRGIEWVNKEYKNPFDATKVRNPATGIIEIIHRFELATEEKGNKRTGGVIDYSMKIELKDGRYRYTINNFNLKDASRHPIEKWLDKTDKAYDPIYEYYLQQVDDFAQKLIISLKAGMLPPAPKKADEW